MNHWLADITLWGQLITLALVACDAWYLRNDRLTRRVAEREAALLLFFAWVTIVDVDGRYNLLQAVDLPGLMAEGWRWPFRLLLIVTGLRLWWALRRP